MPNPTDEIQKAAEEILEYAWGQGMPARNDGTDAEIAAEIITKHLAPEGAEEVVAEAAKQIDENLDDYYDRVPEMPLPIGGPEYKAWQRRRDEIVQGYIGGVFLSAIMRVRPEIAVLEELVEACKMAADFLDGFQVDEGAGARVPEAEAAYEAVCTARAHAEKVLKPRAEA